MIEHCIKKPSTLDRLRGGPAGPFLDGFVATLLDDGYAAETAARFLSAADHVGRWSAQRGWAMPDLDEERLDHFVRHLPRCRCRRGAPRARKRVKFKVHRLLRYLRQIGVVTNCAPEVTHEPLVAEYVGWMRDRRGLAASSIGHSVRVVEALLGAVANDPARLDAAGVRQFVLEYIRRHAPASAGCVTTIVRCFLRWLVLQGRSPTDLTEAVPRVPTWQLARLPRYLPDDDIERLIAACKRPSAAVRRDGAMLLLLARLGLRAADVVGLRHDDVDWKRGRLCVAGKTRREVRLPLPQDVGDAILAYLQSERPSACTDRIFLTTSTPVRAISASGLRDIVRRAFERSGVQTPSHGAHILRHSLATRLLREGATLDTIGAVLRHRDVNTTAIYAKVDVNALRQVAQPWPGVEVSPC